MTKPPGVPHVPCADRRWPRPSGREDITILLFQNLITVSSFNLPTAPLKRQDDLGSICRFHELIPPGLSIEVTVGTCESLRAQYEALVEGSDLQLSICMIKIRSTEQSVGILGENELVWAPCVGWASKRTKH